MCRRARREAGCARPDASIVNRPANFRKRGFALRTVVDQGDRLALRTMLRAAAVRYWAWPPSGARPSARLVPASLRIDSEYRIFSTRRSGIRSASAQGRRPLPPMPPTHARSRLGPPEGAHGFHPVVPKKAKQGEIFKPRWRSLPPRVQGNLRDPRVPSYQLDQQATHVEVVPNPTDPRADPRTVGLCATSLPGGRALLPPAVGPPAQAPVLPPEVRYRFVGVRSSAHTEANVSSNHPRHRSRSPPGEANDALSSHPFPAGRSGPLFPPASAPLPPGLLLPSRRSFRLPSSRPGGLPAVRRGQRGGLPREVPSTVIMVGDTSTAPITAVDFKKKFEAPYKALLDAGCSSTPRGHHDTPARTAQAFNWAAKRHSSSPRRVLLRSTATTLQPHRWLRRIARQSRIGRSLFPTPIYSWARTCTSRLSTCVALEPLFV